MSTSAVEEKAVILGFGKESKNGFAVTHNFAKIPHLLISGAAGYGKTVIAKSIAFQGAIALKGLLFIAARNGEPEVRVFEEMGAKVATNHPNIVYLLVHLVEEMKARLSLFKEKNVNDIVEFNMTNLESQLKRCFIFVDDLCKLLEYKFIEEFLNELVFFGGQTGIHLIMTTQNPEAISAQIKNDQTARLCGFYPYYYPHYYEATLGHPTNIRLDCQAGQFIYFSGERDIQLQTSMIDHLEMEKSIQLDYTSGLLVK